jgi:hypothetical protein
MPPTTRRDYRVEIIFQRKLCTENSFDGGWTVLDQRRLYPPYVPPPTGEHKVTSSASKLKFESIYP